jgi:IS605 OrfB family transposase
MTEIPMRTFSIREKNERQRRKIKAFVLTYKHIENMLTLLIGETYDAVLAQEPDKREWNLLNNLLNPIVMKGVLSRNTGGEKTRDGIALVNEQLGHHHLLKELKKHYDVVNDKNLSMVLRELKANWKGYFKNRKDYYANPGKYTGEPQRPKPKSLKNVYAWALDMEESKWSVKRKNQLSVTLGKRQHHIPLVFKGYLAEHKAYLKSLTIKISHGEVYYQFSHGKPREAFAVAPTLKKKQTLYAGLDIGVKNLAALFINDKTSPSLVFNNAEGIDYNIQFNKKIAKLNTRINEEVKTTKLVNDREVPDTYSIYGKALQKEKSKLFEKRNRYFDTVFHQLAKRFCEYCWCAGVTDLVISKNLTFVKSNGDIKHRKKGKQTFYQIPFGRLLKQIEEKAKDYGMNVKAVDEAYTSKTSCLTANAKANQRKQDNGLEITSNDTNGYRGGKSNKLGRGLFKDTQLQKVYHSDVGGAANHIKIAFEKKINFDYLRTHLFKLANPIKIKSAAEFDEINRRIGVAG